MGLIRADPLRAIGEPDYFYEAVVEAEKRWRERGSRLCALGDLDHLRKALAALSARGATKNLSYTPHQQSDAVLLTSSEVTFEDDI